MDVKDSDYQDFTAFSNAVWLAITSLSTVGFGDFFPVTFMARSVVLTSVIFIGTTVVSLMFEVHI